MGTPKWVPTEYRDKQFKFISCYATGPSLHEPYKPSEYIFSSKQVLDLSVGTTVKQLLDLLPSTDYDQYTIGIFSDYDDNRLSIDRQIKEKCTDYEENLKEYNKQRKVYLVERPIYAKLAIAYKKYLAEERDAAERRQYEKLRVKYEKC